MNPFLKEYATDKTDEELIHFVQEGDRKSLEELLMKHQPYIYNIAWKMVHDPDDAADLAQEAMIKNFDDMASGFDNKGTKTLRTLSKTLCSKHKMPKPLVGRRQMKAVTMIIIIHTFDLCHSRKTKKLLP